MSDETTADEAEEAPPTDEEREALLARIGDELGDGLVDSHIKPGDDLWIRVSADAWLGTGEYLRHGLQCRYFDFLSAIDWMPSPFGRDMDSAVDTELEGAGDDEDGPAELVTGYAGGDTRFQVFARVNNVVDLFGITVKVDVPDDCTVDSWLSVYAGTNWHEREVHEMYGISFRGHPDLRNIYLPTAFEGYPLRKDFPLLARQVKPWPGIVDVEVLPGEDDEGDES